MNKLRYGFEVSYDPKRKYIYVLGGNGGKAALNHCEKYSLENDEWVDIKPMILAKYFSSACIFNNEFIFVIGGANPYALKDI